MLLLGNSPYSVNRSFTTSELVLTLFPTSDHSPDISGVQDLKTFFSYALFYLVVLVRRLYPIPATPSWSKVEVAMPF